ncbi:MAG TPA: DUF4349 domain-containing protein [Micromonosporaceae bacterium]
MWKRTAAALIGLSLAGALVGCSADNRNASKSSSAPISVNHGPDAGTNAAGSAAGPRSNGGTTDNGKTDSGKVGQTVLSPADVQRSIIYTGSVVIRVKDVDAAAAAASSLATGAGGYVGGDNRNIDASRSTATLTLRIPSAAFYTTLSALDALGTPQNRNVSTQDVTQQVIDVQSRLNTEQAAVDRIRTLISGTTSIGQIVTLENELTDRESDVESMEAQLRSLTDLTTLSTITVSLLGPEAHVTAVKKPHRGGFVGGLQSGWDGFVKSVSAVLLVLGAVLPFAIAIGVPVAIVLWFLRRRRRTVPAATTEPQH